MTNLALSITHADGRVSRWGPDEPNAVDIPNDLTFSTSIPGGFKNCTTSLLRRITQDYDDLNLFDTIRVYGPGNQTAWEGRTAQFPRSHGDGFSIAPSAVGWSAHLLDDPSFREIYVDRSTDRWRDASLPRQNQLLAVPVAVGSMSVVSDVSTALPAVQVGISDTWAQAGGFVAEAWYDAGAGLTVARTWSNWITSPGIGSGGGSWEATAFSTNIDDGTSFPEASLNFLTTFSGTLDYSPATPRRYSMVQVGFRAGPAGTVGVQWNLNIRLPAVYGGHGLTYRTITGNAPGFYASDVIADIVSRTSPLLTYTTGTGGSIQPTTFAIPHLVFADPTTGSDAISFVNAYHQYDWGVYDNKQFFFRPANSDTLTWEARLSEGARVDLEGDTADQVYNGVYVTYSDAIGVQKSVGPPGAAADATDASLADTSTDNPVNAAGIPRRWAVVNISQPTDLSGATQIGFVWLAEHSLPQRRGTLTLTGTVTHPTEGKVPVWRVRAGDFIRISDHPADVPRRIIETSYTHANGGVLSATLDNTVFKLESIIERALGVQMVGII